jgi:exodeoxyribonuclease VII large subunit
MNKSYTVSEITQYIKNLMTNDIFLSSVYVSGEISNLKLHTSSHIYFTLKDENASIRAVMFSNYTKLLRFVPADGMKVIIYGYVSVYEKNGQYQVTVSNIIPEGYGALYLAFEQLKDKLRLKGYFNEAAKKMIPVFPEQVAIVTSVSGAALKDFLNVASRRAKGIPIHVYNTLVQGQTAAKQIAGRIEEINRIGKADVIVLARGGGSIEDLWPFNEEIVADAIYDSRIPVVTGVGHETDNTIADMVADRRAPTPSAAAEMVFPDMFSVGLNITDTREKIFTIMNTRLKNCRKDIENISGKTALKKPELLFERHKMDIDNNFEKVSSMFYFMLTYEKQEIENKISILTKINPLNILKKGFSYATDKENRNVNSVKNIHPDDVIKVKLYDGDLTAAVKEVDIYEPDTV